MRVCVYVYMCAVCARAYKWSVMGGTHHAVAQVVIGVVHVCSVHVVEEAAWRHWSTDV